MTVKEKKRGRPPGARAQLNGQIIISAAKVLMREEGATPSIRKLATSLNVDAMAIYHYFKNKDALLEAITTSLVEDIYEPTPSDDWKDELNKLSGSYLKLLHTYSGLLETLLSMESVGPASVFCQRFYLVLTPLKLLASDKKNALDLLVDYLHGYALAMSCNKEKSRLSIDMFTGALGLYCVALENVKKEIKS